MWKTASDTIGVHGEHRGNARIAMLSLPSTIDEEFVDGNPLNSAKHHSSSAMNPQVAR